MPRRTPPLPRTVVAALCLPWLLAAVGCTGDGSDTSTASPASPASRPTGVDPSPTPSGQVLLDRVRGETTPARVDFCDLVPTGAVREALDVPADEPAPPVERVVPGDLVEVELDGTSTAVPVDEYACTWRLRGGPTPERVPGARAVTIRVFAPVVTSARALDLVRAARADTRCSSVDDLARVGLPGVALACDPGELRLEGLVGDAWVVCGLTREDLTAQLGARVLAPRLTDWCATALQRVDSDG